MTRKIDNAQVDHSHNEALNEIYMKIVNVFLLFVMETQYRQTCSFTMLNYDKTL